MNAPIHQLPLSPQRRQQGISLIIVLIMLVIIGLTSAAAIRSATSGEKLSNNLRVQNLAQQYAEAALRFCEAELAKADADREPTLKEAKIYTPPVLTAATAATQWNVASTWIGAGGASDSKTTIPIAQLKSVDSSFSPTVLPQCVAEKQVMNDLKIAYVITARGFSPDYTANALTGATTSGSVVWLQSTLYLE